MNQTKKRLAIIKLAISMTDTETIQLQVLKLGLLKTDSKMREILTLLSEKSYARAQGLISAYIETPSNTVLQRTSQESMPIKEPETVVEKASPQTLAIPEPTPEESMLEPIQKPVKKPIKNVTLQKETVYTLQEKIQAAKDKAIIDEFELFIDEPETELKEAVLEEVNYDALLDITPAPKKMSTQTVNYDALLNVEAADVLNDNISLDITEHKKDTFFDEETPLQYNRPSKDTFFDEVVELKTEVNQKPIDLHDMSAQEKMAQDNFMQETFGEKPTKKQSEKKHSIIKPFSKKLHGSLHGKLPEVETKDDIKLNQKNSTPELIPIEKTFTSPADYKAITYIDQKFRNMKNQYPPIDENPKSFDSVDALLVKISSEGYSEKEIEEVIKKTEELSTSSKAESAQLLLICAATESKYAQFRLARALFSGDLLQKNLAEAFTLINRLAVNDDYPEAICDLAQFYEKGIGISKDKKKAQTLYKEAMDLGIHRATDHYERIRKQNKGFFSFKK